MIILSIVIIEVVTIVFILGIVKSYKKVIKGKDNQIEKLNTNILFLNGLIDEYFKNEIRKKEKEV